VPTQVSGGGSDDLGGPSTHRAVEFPALPEQRHIQVLVGDSHEGSLRQFGGGQLLGEHPQPTPARTAAPKHPKPLNSATGDRPALGSDRAHHDTRAQQSCGVVLILNADVEKDDAASTEEGNPAITASIAFLDSVRNTDADGRSFTNVHKTKRPPAAAGGRLAWSGPLSLVAGTGFEPATSGL
jgi:hypothetical protein